MRLLYFIFICTFFVPLCKGADFNSYEVNQIDLTPLHDAIIFNDIADIMNELENSMNPHLNTHLFSDSNSSEDVEDLLSEYQQYLDKAHKQRINYIEKSKSKNKVPLIRHEKFTKMKQSKRSKYDDDSSDYFNKMKYPQVSLPEPLQLLMSHNAKVSADNKPEFARPQNYETISNTVTQTNTEKSLLNLFPTFSKSIEDSISSCYCKINQIPCKCSCKQCFTLIDSMPAIYFNKYDNDQGMLVESYPKSSKYTKQNNLKNVIDDKLNIHIKVDVQLPKIISELGSIHKYENQGKSLEGEGLSSREMTYTNVNLPFPFLNFPTPIELLGHKNGYNKHDSSPMHKITIHKKKKTRLSNNNKKHMGKKVITFHNIKFDQPKEKVNAVENKEISNNDKKTTDTTYNKENVDSKVQTTRNQSIGILSNYTNNKTIPVLTLKNINGSIESIYLTVNLTKKGNNDTNESTKIENSIETDFVDKVSKSTIEPSRFKRSAFEQNTKTTTPTGTNVTAISPKLLANENHTLKTKKNVKTVVGDMELLYWPNTTKNVTLVKSKNITVLILERETKKAKLNITREKIRSNRTVALEQAIFGDVNWNDVDTVAPIFMSFVGKYIRGILTFCSQSICHSMKCAEKTCLYRICTPDNRFNHKGHCTGNDNTDSVAAMESIMDLPSNIVFDIVDILKDKMLGKIYGKATLCIISKCITFVASKKVFQISKCTCKELSSSGHCPNMKNVKIM